MPTSELAHACRFYKNATEWNSSDRTSSCKLTGTKANCPSLTQKYFNCNATCYEEMLVLNQFDTCPETTGRKLRSSSATDVLRGKINPAKIAKDLKTKWSFTDRDSYVAQLKKAGKARIKDSIKRKAKELGVCKA